MKGIVTQVREMKSGVRVTIDDRVILRMTRKDCKTLPLKEGDVVDIEEIQHDLVLQQYPDALNRAVRLLAIRARSCFEIEKKLTDAFYLDDTVDLVLTKLQSDGLLDDRAFAMQWARDRSARQIGKTRIAHELRQKGIPGEMAEQAMAHLDPRQQDESAAKLAAKLRKRYQNLAAEDARRKIIMAMQRRGYTYGEILTVLNLENLG